MSNRKRKTYYKITFQQEQEQYQVCAREVHSSDLYGLIEIAEFVFPENKLVYNPGEERLRKEFSGIERVWIPYHAILRIDEISDTREQEIKIVPLHGGAHAQGGPQLGAAVGPFKGKPADE